MMPQPPETLGYSRSGNRPGTARNGITVTVPAVPPPYRAEQSRNPGTIPADWTVEKINTRRRAARPDTCPRCGADLLAGDDHDRCAARAHVDPIPVDHVHEIAALLAGRESYDLIRGALYHREPWRHRSAHRPHPVLLEHTCPVPPKETLF